MLKNITFGFLDKNKLKMLTRIVKMTFQENEIETFKKVFQENGNKIRSSKGCLSVDLMQDIKQKNIFFTYSIWESEQDLNNYRMSDLFREVWANTKILFADKPQAWSLKKMAM